MPGEAQSGRERILATADELFYEHGFRAVGVDLIVARAGVAKGTFYVHFKDRAAFVDAMHARFHAWVEAALGEAIAGLPPGAERLFRGSEAYLDVSLANRGVKALSLEARSDPAVQDSMAARRERLAAAGVADLEAMGWDDTEAAAQLLGAMTREISVLEFDAGHRLPASRRALKRFLGI